MSIKKRRRGVELFADIYAATRDILNKEGLSSVTFEKVANKAATSKSVIYRYWDTPFSLSLLAIQDKIQQENHGSLDDTRLTGNSLEEDLLQLAHRFLQTMNSFGRPVMGSWFDGITHEQSEQMDEIISNILDIDSHAVDRVLKRAVNRGELKQGKLPHDIQFLLFDWLRYQAFMEQSVDEKRLNNLITNILVPAYKHVLG